MFGIQNSRDFYEKLVAEYEDLHHDPMSARIAVNCAITAYHLAEWIWGDWLKGNLAAQAAVGVHTVDEFKKWVDTQTPYFAAMQSITNGTKHFNQNAFSQTQLSEGAFDRNAFDPNAFSVNGLLIEVQTDSGAHWYDYETVLEQLLLFWREFLLKHSPYTDLSLPPSSVAEFEQ
jgi:hypothetical protein